MNDKLSGDRIEIAVIELQLRFYRQGKLSRKYPVALGKEQTPTPVGEWRIIKKGLDWGGGFGPRWLGLNVPWGIYGIHGTNAPESIGTRVSHGCIRLFNQDILELYELTELDTPVHILGPLPGLPASDGLFRRYAGKEYVTLQFALRKAGFDPGEADGRFGPRTRAALQTYQFSAGLEPTGEITPRELQLLGLVQQ